MDTEFKLAEHVRNYHYDCVTRIDQLIPSSQAEDFVERIDGLIALRAIKFVDHQGKGTAAVSDSGGRYLHYIFEGDDVRAHLPELAAIYHAILPIVASVTHQDVIVSPYPRSDINIKVYPPGGGTLGEHRDTNGITVLLFLTTNKEAPLRMQIPRCHPATGHSIEHRHIHARAGSLLIMKGRDCVHDCEPTVTERKITVVLNYYVRGDTWRHDAFDSFVYDGIDPMAPTLAAVATDPAPNASSDDEPLAEQTTCA